MSTKQARDLSNEIDELPELLPLPHVALTLLNACKDPNVGARDLCQIVSGDTSLSVRLLQVSNSTLYGLGGQIKTVEHASVVLGLRGLRNLAMSIIAQGVFQDGKAKNPAVSLLWNHSLGCATVARAIASNVDGVCPDEAFVSGIIHDVGKLVLIQLLEDKYDLIPRALDGEVMVDLEVELYGICHAELGERCAEEWGLPHEMASALRNHHCVYDSTCHSRLSAVVVAANQLSKVWEIGNDSYVEMDPRSISESNDLPFDESGLLEVQQQCVTEYEQIQFAFQG